MTSLVDKAILSGANNHPPMLEKDMYDSWKSKMELYMLNREHERMILESVENGPLLWPTVEENGVTSSKKYSELSTTEAIQADFPVANAPRAVDLANSHVSTSIDQDAPLTSILSTQDQENSLIISQDFGESPKTPHFHDDPLHESLHEKSTSQGSSSNVRPIDTLFKSLGRWTKDHPIANVNGDPSCFVSTRKQLQTDAMWCYFDAFLTSVEPKKYKQAMIKPSWINAMQEEIYEFERLQVWELVSSILVGADNHPPTLEKDMYDSWKSRMELYMMNRQHGRMILESVENGPLVWTTIKENEVTRPRKYSELSATEATQADCDVKATNIILQGLPQKVYALVSNHRIADKLWERIQLLMQAPFMKK
nr:hypothetical protein [Tanacetum cinerariifolium]